jgi:NADH-quinone oxidoreductase subunit I
MLLVLEFVRGLSITIRKFFFEPHVTVEFPEEKRPVTRRFRGRHELRRYDDGLERCIGCSLCAAACPADAILVIAGENTDEARYSPGERYAATYEINMLRCIFCGYCEEACPTNAIVLGPEYEISTFTRDMMIYTKEHLIVPPPPGMAATPQQTREGEHTRSIIPGTLSSDPRTGIDNAPGRPEAERRKRMELKAREDETKRAGRA